MNQKQKADVTLAPYPKSLRIMLARKPSSFEISLLCQVGHKEGKQSMARSGKTYAHFIVKLMTESGPDPAVELRNLLEQCRRNQKGTAWLATSDANEKFDRSGNSICVIFHQPSGSQRVEAVVARILSQEERSPPAIHAEVRTFYAPWRDQLKNWWELGGYPEKAKTCDLVLTEFNSLDEIPGHAWDKARSASAKFNGPERFSGWTFDDELLPLRWLRGLTGTRPERG